MRPSKDVWVLGLLLVVLVVAGCFFAAPAQEESTVSSTYNPGPKGVKAFYTLLGERLGYSVDRLDLPYTDIPAGAAVLVTVQPLASPPITRAEQDALIEWVRRGGVAIIMSDRLASIPKSLRSGRALGSGRIYVFESRRAITNEGVRDYRNAVKILDIISKRADGEKRLVLFDEYHHALGRGESKSIFALMGRQVKLSLVILAVAGLVLCHTRGKRFGAVRGLPRSETLRPGFEFVESVARLYQRARATGLAAEVLCGSFRRALCARLALPADAPREQVLRVLGHRSGEDAAERVGKLLRACESARAGHQPTESELLGIAGEIRELEEELGLARVDA